jgi:hypothetical protein
MRTVPLNRSADLLVDGYEPQGLISVAALHVQSNRGEIDSVVNENSLRAVWRWCS